MNKKQLRQVWEKTNGHCHFCGDPVEFEKYGSQADGSPGSWQVDHVIHASKGGIDNPENYLPICTACNGNKGRWHRSGKTLRELIDLGTLVRDEIAKGTALGVRLAQLRDKRDAKREARRAQDQLKRASKTAIATELAANEDGAITEAE